MYRTMTQVLLMYDDCEQVAEFFKLCLVLKINDYSYTRTKHIFLFILLWGVQHNWVVFWYSYTMLAACFIGF